MQVQRPERQSVAVVNLMEPRLRSLALVNYSLALETVYCSAVAAVVASYRKLDAFTSLTSSWRIDSVGD